MSEALIPACETCSGLVERLHETSLRSGLHPIINRGLCVRNLQASRCGEINGSWKTGYFSYIISQLQLKGSGAASRQQMLRLTNTA